MSGLAVRSYKQGLGVFIADREREAGAPLEGWWRQITEARPRIETFSAGREAAGAPPIPPSSSFSSTPHGSCVWSGWVWPGLIWAGLDGEAVTWPWSALHWSVHTQARHKHITQPNSFHGSKCHHKAVLIETIFSFRLSSKLPYWFWFSVGCFNPWSTFGYRLHVIKNHILSQLDFLHSGSIWFQFILV